MPTPGAVARWPSPTCSLRRPDRFGGWVQVRAASLDPDALLAALKDGHFYSPTGPEIADISIDDNLLRVACSPARAIHVVGRGSVARYKHSSEAGMTEAEFPLDPFLSAYCWVTVIDAKGKRAWSNPIWFDDIPFD